MADGNITVEVSTQAAQAELEWLRQHPTLARPSIGRGIAVVHAPRAVA